MSEKVKPNVAVFVPGVFPAVHVMDRNMFITKLRLFNFPVNSTEQLYAVFNFSFLASSGQLCTVISDNNLEQKN